MNYTRTKTLGVSNKIWKTIHYFIVIIMLQSSFIAPSQTIYKRYNELFSSPNVFLPLLTNPIVSDSYTEDTTNDIELENEQKIESKKSNTVYDKVKTESTIFYSDIVLGSIGFDNQMGFDNPKDNLFKINLSKANLDANKKYILEYEVNGVDENSVIGKSINDNYVTGGYLVKFKNEWIKKTEELDFKWLKEDGNIIFFNVPEGANYQYKIRNLVIKVVEEPTKKNPKIVLNNQNVFLTKEEKIYLNGFIKVNEISNKKIFANNQELELKGNLFEGYIKANQDENIVFQIKENNTILDELKVSKITTSSADESYAINTDKKSISKYFEINKLDFLEINNAKLTINDSALLENKYITSKVLRKIDLAPLESGMVNVTKGGKGYRFLPDGTVFNKAVVLEIPYDSTLIPHGFSAKDIQTFYFDTKKKSWIALEKDSVDYSKKRIISQTTHFTDYINGIIQTPESPQTSAFTPTMMNDIKAADPSSEMTIISPPEVSQKGDANVSYPIKIPAGRNGMQPQVAIQYNSDGGNGWLGEGWNINTPAITIDTRWGVPTFDAINESEIYNLNGEQLMYPKLNDQDWMPNRHYDVDGAPIGTYNTNPVNRSSDLKFTPRKQGSFAIIERLGTATTNYHWKVRGTDGTINWYGGKDGVIDNAVIKDGRGNIVHWALYMTEDVYGNTVKYEYTPVSTRILSGQSGQNANLNGGIVFHIENIKYTGFNDSDYKYEVVFNSLASLRQDISINARLGVKQIEPYFLDKILVRKIGSSLPIRQYKLNFGYGKFKKGQLLSVSELDKNSKEFYKHTFEYYDDLKLDDADVYFSDGVEEIICNDEFVPCRDLDHDGVCDENDACMTIPGPISNNGCPEEEKKCFSVIFPLGFVFNECLINGMNVSINGISLTGGPFYSVNEIVAAIQIQHPVTSFNNNELTISNTYQVYNSIVFTSENCNEYTQFFNKCTSAIPLNKSNIDYSRYFSNLLQNNSFVLSDGVTLEDSSCPDYLTNDTFLIRGYIPSFDSSASLLGSSKSEAISTGFYIGIGIGKNRFTKMTTFGVQWNWGNDKSEALTALIDINGDGLDDIVSKEGSSLYYKKHKVTRTYNATNEPVITHSFDVKKPIIGIDNFYRAFGRNRSTNFQITFGLRRIGGFIGWDKSKSTAETDMYFTDGNGDGLMDIVRDGVVYFNRLDANGNPNFIPDSQGTENLVITAAPRTVEVPDEYNEDEVTLPAFDVVKVWEAPADGDIKIDNTIQLTDTSKEAVVTVEMNKLTPPPLRCYTVTFPVPTTTSPTLYNYFFGSGIFSYGNGSSCGIFTGRFKSFKVNGIVYYPSNNNTYLTHYLNGIGLTNLCPSTTPYESNVIQNPNFAQNVEDWLLSSPMQGYDIVENHIQNQSALLGNNSYTTQINFQNSYFISSNSFSCSYSTEVTPNNINFGNWHTDKFISNGGGGYNITVGIPTNISVNNNQLINNPYTLYNNTSFSQFQTQFQTQFQGANVALNSENNTITITINNTEEVFTNISLSSTDGSVTNIYNFSETPCYQPLTINKNYISTHDLEKNWYNYKPSKEDLKIGLKEYKSRGNKIINENDNFSYTLLFDHKKENFKDEKILYYKDDNKFEFRNLNGDIIKLKEDITVLENLLPNDIETKYQEAKKIYINSTLRQVLEEQKDAQAWLEEYYTKQNQENSTQFSTIERTINQTTCNDTPNELCLLFGTQLSASNTNVTNTLTTNCTGQTLTVKKGDRIYFRVHANNNGNPPVNWDPKVSYISSILATTTDANGHTPYVSSYSDGFVLSNKQPVTFPGNSGSASVTWTPFTINPTDKVTYQIIKETVSSTVSDDDEAPSVVNSSIIYSQVCNPNVSTSVAPINLNNIVITAQPAGSDLNNLSQTFFYFKVISSSNVDWKNSVWKPEMDFTTTTAISPNPDGSNPEGNVTSTTKVYPVPDYDLYRLYPCGTPFAKKNIASINGGVNLTVKPSLAGVFSSGDNGKINFVVKRGSTFIGSRLFTITNGAVSINNSTSIALGNGASEIEMMYTIDDSNGDSNAASLLSKLALTSNTLATITYGSTTLNVPKNEITLYQKTDPKLGYFFRQWGQFMYRPANVTGALPTGIAGTNLIKEEALQVSLSQSEANQLSLDLDAINDSMTQAQLDAFQNSHQNYINSLAFLSANPTREIIDGALTDRWIGLHRENYASENAYRAEKLEQSIISFEDNYPNIEQGVINTGAYAISKYSKGVSNNNFSSGINGFGYGINGSISNGGLNNSLTDYIDYNGDRYPDIVTKESIQFTNKTGGLYSPTTGNGQDISTSTSDSVGFGASGSFGKSNQDSGDTDSVGSGFKRFDSFRGNSGAGISGNFTNGNSVTQRFWTDVNGDGLSDVLVTSGGTTNVTLNLGPETSNSSITNWGALPLFNSESSGISGGLGVNKWNGSAEAGISLTTSWNKSTNTLVDISGDGLLDMVYADDNLGVKLNLGNNFYDAGVWTSAYNLKKESSTVSASINAGFTFALVWRFWFISFKIPAMNWNGTPLSTSTNKTKKSIIDYDGDGYVDLVEQINPSKIKIYYSRIRRTDKLKTVTNPLGGTFTLDYKVQPIDYDNPNPKWAMSSIIINDKYDKVNDGEDVYKKQFVYEKGRYDRREREFYGYKTVKVEDYTIDASGNETIYRTSIFNYHNQSYFLNGLLEEAYIIKGNDDNKKFSKTKNFYELYQLNTTNDEIDLATSQSLTYDVGGSEGRRSAAVLLKKTVSEIYELAPTAQLTSEIEMKYDTKGRIIEYLDKGNAATTSDDYSSKIDYHTSMNSLNIISIPKSIKVYDNTNALKRERKTDVNTTTGDITTVSANNYGTWSVTTMEYDQYGNLIAIKYPENESGQSMYYNYTFDAVYHKYLVSIKDAFGYTSTATYQSDFDKPTVIVDLAGNKMQYEYDSFGRNTKIIAPKEIAAGKKYTIKFDYYPYLSLLPSGTGITSTNFVPVAVTSHYDPEHPTNDIETYSFVDGLARSIQVKKDIAINTGSVTSPNFIEALSISGKMKYDEFGRAREQFHPYWETKSLSSGFSLNEYNSSYSSKVEYNELDRSIKSIDQEGNESTVIYSIGTDINGVLALKTKSDVDQNGTQHLISETYKDIRGRVISTMNAGGTNGAIWTKFNYNSINELIDYVDDEGLTTNYKYDMLGRKTYVNHPDNGETYVTFDKASNMTRLQTANLSSIGQAVNYKYEYNRLQEIIYPTVNGNQSISNVTYKYGNPGSGNETGRLIFQQDATGTQDFKYGNMGEMIYNSRTVVAPNLPTRTFETHFEYDSWNRIQQLTYPDGEKVTYAYDLGGNLNQMTGQYNGDNYNYIERIDYDYFEQRTYLLYGNKTETFYDYTSALRRLNNLVAKTSSGVAMFDNSYRYDKVGNVTRLDNTASYNPDNLLGGSYSHRYTYDNLNRLTDARGGFDGAPAGGTSQQSMYDLTMKYNNTHGIVNKTQLHIQNNLNNPTNTYSNDYSYYGGSHKVKEIIDQNTGFSENFEYDLNGNLVNKSNSEGGNRKLFWDESNRLRVIDENDQMQHYIYDAAGERTLKASSHVEQVYENGQLVNSSNITFSTYTTYPSAFLVIDANQQYSKHYYAGTQRIVSKLGEENVSIFEARRKTTEAIGKDTKEPEVSYETIKQIQITDLQAILDKAKRGKALFKEYKPENEPVVDTEGKEIERAPAQVGIYFFHPDHLGSSTFLTDGSGNPYQFFINLPFGETMYEQHSYTENFVNPYKFNGKEQDIETGLYYYGARYYDPKTSIWLSVDPMAEKFPNWNPYNYTMQNPINLTDPTGMAPEGGETDPKTNVMVYIYHQSELQDRINKFEGRTGWDAPIFAVDINDAMEQLSSKYGKNSIDNLLIISHGRADSGPAIGSYYRNQDGFEIRYLLDDSTLNTYVNSSTKGEFLADYSDELLYSNINALSKISDMVINNGKGNIIFESCALAGRGDRIPTFITEIMGGSKFNFVFNVGLGGITGEDRDDSIKYNVNPNEHVLRYQGGNKSYIKDLIIKNNNQNPVEFIE